MAKPSIIDAAGGRFVMLRDRSLVPLSHQHHNGLALCILTERALGLDSSPENVARQSARIAARFEFETANHIALEESLLFPACGRSELVTRLIGEHRRMEALVATLREAPTAAVLAEFVQLLRAHIRLEENELFEDVQRRLPRATLDSLGREFETRAIRVCL
ncbi:MAG TPA: hemerythrin domain-containing protein [Bryobacteraceae bacterium]|nr:hemerythrin domain-containing protein [Bryobacteraceae bacterium]